LAIKLYNFPKLVHALFFFQSRLAGNILLYGKLRTRKKIRYEKEIKISHETVNNSKREVHKVH